MSSATNRQEAIQSIAGAAYQLNQVNFKETHVKDLFGANVFNEADAARTSAQDRSSRPCKRRSSRARTLDPAIADAVATAMKDWAIEHGATHFTHIFQPMTGLTAEKHDSFLHADRRRHAPSPSSAARNWSRANRTPRRSPPAASAPPSRPAATRPGTRPAPPTSCESPNGATLVIPTAFAQLDRRGPRQENAAAALDGGPVARRPCASSSCSATRTPRRSSPPSAPSRNTS